MTTIKGDSVYKKNGFKIIETPYNGIYYASRTEARWAAYFDHMGINYISEFNAFEIDLEYDDDLKEFDTDLYLPDFYLPDLQCYVEVKGNYKFEKDRYFKTLIAGADTGTFENGIFLLSDLPKPETLMMSFHPFLAPENKKAVQFSCRPLISLGHTCPPSIFEIDSKRLKKELVDYQFTYVGFDDKRSDYEALIYAKNYNFVKDFPHEKTLKRGK